MSTADGSVIILAELDDKKAQSDLNKLSNKMEKIQNQLDEKTGEQSTIKLQLEAAKQEAQKTEKAIASLKAEYASLDKQTGIEGTAGPYEYMAAKDRQNAIAAELRTQESLLEGQDKETQRLDKAYAKVYGEVNKLTNELEDAQTEAGQLAAKLAAAGSPAGQVANLTKEMNERMERFGNRITGLAKRVFVFTLISQALRAMKNGMIEAVQANDQAASAIGGLQNALSGLYSTLASAIMPALIRFIQFITYIVNLISRVIGGIFGVTSGLKQQQKATQGAGGAAKKAGEEAEKALASFDEINKLQAPQQEDTGGGGGGANLGYADELTDELKQKFDLIAGIVGTAFLALGAILLFTGVSPLLGLALLAVGAAMIIAEAQENWSALPENIRLTVSTILGIIGGALLVIGVILTFACPAKIGLGIGLIVAGALTLASVEALNWNALPEKIQETIFIITSIVSSALLVLGIILTFTGHFALGIGLLIAGAIGLATSAAINWDAVTGEISGTIATILAIVGGALLAVGAVLIFSGANIPLGLALMLAGGLAMYGAVKLDWDAVKNRVAKVLDFLDVKIGKFRDGWNDAWDGIAQGVINGVSSAIQWIQNLISWVKDGLSWLNNLLSWGGSLSSQSGGDSTGGGARSSPIASRAAYSAVQLRNVPALAKGAVIPPNREFMAVLGDQRNGTNLEAPEGLIRAIVREESGVAILRQILEAVRECSEKDINMDGRKVGEMVTSYQRQIQRATGG